MSGQLPVDEYHRISLALTAFVRQRVEAARERVAAWDMPPCPSRPVATHQDRQRLPYADEVLPPRPWLRK